VKGGTSPREGERKRIKEKELKEKELKNLSIKEQLKNFVQTNNLTGLEKQRLIDRLTNYPPKVNFLSYASKTLDSIRKEIAEEEKQQKKSATLPEWLKEDEKKEEAAATDQSQEEEANKKWLEELLKEGF
ncbi:hypothetical protein LCY76_22700, partial [Fictibacillus sp. KIGAM418]